MIYSFSYFHNLPVRQSVSSTNLGWLHCSSVILAYLIYSLCEKILFVVTDIMFACAGGNIMITGVGGSVIRTLAGTTGGVLHLLIYII